MKPRKYSIARQDGSVARKIVCAPGVCPGDGKSKITAEEIQESWGKIMNLDDAKALDAVGESFTFLGPLLA